MSSHGKEVVLIGDSLKVKEFQYGLEREGATVALVANSKKAMAYLQEADKPDGIVFIIPVYWENVSKFVDEVKADKRLATVPIIYMGDFIESTDQIVLKRQGVHTLTLGPVPTQEAVRFILSKI
ncbi:MAG: hypothetical protein U9M92_00255 [Patescibacteria group bacterium]|nr:hypothetical protein [Patescibacteria group bacterium]